LILVSRSKLYCEGLTPRLNISESGSYDVGGTPAEMTLLSSGEKLVQGMWKEDVKI
jgi:hypothetical protein